MLRCAQLSCSHSGSCYVIVFGLIHRSRFTDTVTMKARLASEIFLSSLQTQFISDLLEQVDLIRLPASPVAIMPFPEPV